MTRMSRIRAARSMCMTFLVLSALTTLSACGSTESQISQMWYDQRWESKSE